MHGSFGLFLDSFIMDAQMTHGRAGQFAFDVDAQATHAKAVWMVLAVDASVACVGAVLMVLVVKTPMARAGSNSKIWNVIWADSMALQMNAPMTYVVAYTRGTAAKALMAEVQKDSIGFGGGCSYGSCGG
jgi:hypothetical protein